MHKQDAHRGHQLLIDEVQGTLGRYRAQGIRDIEQIAILAQLIGGMVSDLDPAHYDAPEVMRSIALNIAAGNAAKGPSLEASPVVPS